MQRSHLRHFLLFPQLIRAACADQLVDFLCHQVALRFLSLPQINPCQLTGRCQPLKDECMCDQNTPLQANDDFQTSQRGTNDNEYQIYASNAKDLGWEVKTYEEWLNS